MRKWIRCSFLLILIVESLPLHKYRIKKLRLKHFIAQDDYLSVNRGTHAEKYAELMPWYERVDLRILQDYHFKVGEKMQTLQASFDLLNAGNLISSS